MNIGFHESTSNGFLAMGQEALCVGANTFAFFTRNPRGGKAKEIDKQDAQNLVSFSKKNNFAPLVAHAPYTMNPCSSDEGLRKYAKEMMIDDFSRLENIPGCLYNFHPGSHTGQGIQTGIELTSTMIAEVFNAVLGKVTEHQKKCNTILLIETMAGKGSEIGKTFEEIKQIIDLSEQKYGTSLCNYLGVCMDSCHIWDGGYDIVNNLDGVIEDFDKIIGLKRLKAFHLNDSMNDFSTHKDRHEKIGKGHIGLETITKIINHPSLKNLPFILETPNELQGYKEEITLLKSLCK